MNAREWIRYFVERDDWAGRKLRKDEVPLPGWFYTREYVK